jgi:hypothetical protein
MAYRLRFTGSEYVSLPSACSVNWGLGAYSVEFGAEITEFPTSGNYGIIGSDGSTTTGITLRQASGDGALAVITSGTFRFASVAGLVILNEYHVYRLEHDAGGAFRWYRDGVQIGSSGTFTTSSVQTVRAFGRGNSGGTPGYSKMDLGYVELVGFTNAQEWDADLSGGAGSILPTVSGDNQGTLNGFSVPGCWISTGGAGAVLQAAAVSATSAVAALTVGLLLSAAATSVSTSTANLRTGVRLATNASASTISTAALRVGVRFTGAASASTVATGLLSVRSRLSAATNGSTVTTASLVPVSAGLSANAVSATSATGLLSVRSRLSASANGSTVTTASLAPVSAGLSANAVSSTVSSAALTVGVRLAANAVGSSVVSATLSSGFGLSANALSSTIVMVNISTGALFRANAYSNTVVTATFAEDILPVPEINVTTYTVNEYSLITTTSSIVDVTTYTGGYIG